MVSQRLKWFCALVVAAAFIGLLVQARLQPSTLPALARRIADTWTNLFAPRTPPRAPPPGRPFTANPVTYSGPAPTQAELRQLVKGANVIICVLDAARVDHFGAYGYPRETTPSFDRLAKEGILFEQHFCEAPETKPSTVSLLTGLYPETHGLLSNTEPGVMRTSGPSSVPTLEGAFAQAGYATYLVTASPVASPEFGLASDFQHARYPQQDRRVRDDPVAAVQEALGQLIPEWKASQEPFFAYFHVFPPHAPYAKVPEQFVRAFRGKRPPRYWQGSPAYAETRDPPAYQEPESWVEWVNLYDASLRWADSFLGDLEAELRGAGLLDRTVLIVTADHGEAMREHGHAFHATCPYDEALHIPLLIRFPGQRRPVGRVGALTQTIDLFPTLVDLCGISYPLNKVEGKSLAPLLAGEVKEANQYLFARTVSDRPCYVVRDAHSALFLYYGGRTRALYDLDVDPWQARNVYKEDPARAAALEQAFVDFARSRPQPPLGFLDAKQAGGPDRPARPGRPATNQLTEEQRRTLRSLGYVE